MTYRERTNVVGPGVLLEKSSNSNGSVFLVVVGARDPSHIGKILKPGSDDFYIGRSSTASFQVDDNGISRDHCKVRISADGSHLLTDLGSTNGTFVNGIKVNVARLEDGDKIQIGENTVLRFSVQDALDEKHQRSLYDSVQSRFRYDRIRKLSTGGMGELWLATQVGLEGFRRQVVVKKILARLAKDPTFVESFLNEARLAAKLAHRNIIQIYDFGKEDDSYFLAMEYIDGIDLRQLLRTPRTRHTPQHLALRIASDICAGLHYAHSKSDDDGRALSIIHRDVSPENILLDASGSVKLTDFGIASAANRDGITHSNAVVGKHAYMSPEQARGGNLDARTDIYSLGLVLYELLTGTQPLKRATIKDTLMAAAKPEIAPPSAIAQVSPIVEEAVMRAIASKPTDRFATAQAFGDALEQALAKESAQWPPTRPSEWPPIRLSEWVSSGIESREQSTQPATSTDAPDEGGAQHTYRVPLVQLVEQFEVSLAEATDTSALTALRGALQQAEYARTSGEATETRVQRLHVAQEFLGALERGLHTRLHKIDEQDRAKLTQALSAKRSPKRRKTLTDGQVWDFLTSNELPSLKTIAHWLSSEDAVLSEYLPRILRVPVDLRTTLFSLGDLRNVLAHRHTYETNHQDLQAATRYAEWATEEGESVINISFESLEELRSICTKLIIEKVQSEP